jgi:hypothetical protein
MLRMVDSVGAAVIVVLVIVGAFVMATFKLGEWQVRRAGIDGKPAAGSSNTGWRRITSKPSSTMRT